MSLDIKKGIYKHYKGGVYEVIDVARNSETLELFVVYKALYDSKEFGANAVWVRPYNMFIEHVCVDGKEIPRFQYIRSAHTS